MAQQVAEKAVSKRRQFYDVHVRINLKLIRKLSFSNDQVQANLALLLSWWREFGEMSLINMESCYSLVLECRRLIVLRGSVS